MRWLIKVMSIFIHLGGYLKEVTDLFVFPKNNKDPVRSVERFLMESKAKSLSLKR